MGIEYILLYYVCILYIHTSCLYYNRRISIISIISHIYLYSYLIFIYIYTYIYLSMHIYNFKFVSISCLFLYFYLSFYFLENICL